MQTINDSNSSDPSNFNKPDTETACFSSIKPVNCNVTSDLNLITTGSDVSYSNNKSKSKCSFGICAKNLLDRYKELLQQTNEDSIAGDKISKFERDHFLQYHSTLPIRLIVEYTRDPNSEMRFHCCCGNTFLPRSSVSRHFKVCGPARAMCFFPDLKYRGFNVIESIKVTRRIYMDDTDERDDEVEDASNYISKSHNDSKSSSLMESSLAEALTHLKDDILSDQESRFTLLERRLCQPEQSIWSQVNLRAHSSAIVKTGSKRRALQ